MIREELQRKIDSDVLTVRGNHTSIFVVPKFSRRFLIKLSDKGSANIKKRYFEELFKILDTNISGLKRLNSSVGVLAMTDKIVNISDIERCLHEMRKIYLSSLDDGFDYFIGVDSDKVYWKFETEDRYFKSHFETSRSIDAAAKIASKAKKEDLTPGIYMGERYVRSIGSSGRPSFDVIDGVGYKAYHHANTKGFRTEGTRIDIRSNDDFAKKPLIFNFIDIVASSKLLYKYNGKDVLAAKYKMFKSIYRFFGGSSHRYRGDALFVWTTLINAQDVLSNLINLIMIAKQTKNIQRELQFRDFGTNGGSLKIDDNFKIRISSDHTDGARVYRDHEPISQHAMFNEFINDYAEKGGIVIGKNPYDTLGLDKNYAVENSKWAPNGYSFYKITDKFFHDANTPQNVTKVITSGLLKKWDIASTGQQINFKGVYKDQVRNFGPDAKKAGQLDIRDARTDSEHTTYNGIHYYIRNNINNIVPVNDMTYAKGDIYEK